MKIIQASTADVEAILTIQQECYPVDLIETAESFAAKIVNSKGYCFIAKDKQQTLGYLITLPWVLGKPFPIDSSRVNSPSKINCLYIHDLAVGIKARSMGAGRRLLEHVFKLSSKNQFNSVALVAIEGADSYWQRLGFTPVIRTPELDKALSQYGSDAVYMVKTLIPN